MDNQEAQYEPCPEAEAIAAKTIEKVPEFANLRGVPIGYFTNASRMASHGRAVLGQARGVNRFAREVYASDYAFVIVLNKTEWDTASKQRRAAIIDHELCHCGWDPETGTAFMKPHEVQEFAGVIRRHGLWTEDVSEVAAAIQPHIPGFEDAGKSAKRQIGTDPVARKAKQKAPRPAAKKKGGGPPDSKDKPEGVSAAPADCNGKAVETKGEGNGAQDSDIMPLPVSPPAPDVPEAAASPS